MGEEISYGDDAADEANCYSNRQKLCCQRYITCMSILSFIIGLLLAVYGYMSIDGATVTPEVGSYQTEFTVEADTVLAYMCMAGGMLAIVIALLGCLTAYCTNPCVSCPFGLLAFIIALLCFAVAGMVFASDTASQLYDDVCNVPVTFMDAEAEPITGTAYMQEQYGAVVDDVMCTDECACDDATLNLSGIMALDDAELAEFGAVGRMAADSSLSLIPLSDASDGGSLTIYNECYEHYVEVTESAFVDEGEDAQWQEFVTNGGYEYMSALEADYNCASICYQPLFYLSRSIEESPVEQECVTAFINTVSGNMGVGVVAIVTGLLLLSACIGSVPLCTGFAKGNAQ